MNRKLLYELLEKDEDFLHTVSKLRLNRITLETSICDVWNTLSNTDKIVILNRLVKSSTHDDYELQGGSTDLI